MALSLACAALQVRAAKPSRDPFRVASMMRQRTWGSVSEAPRALDAAIAKLAAGRPVKSLSLRSL